MRRHFALIGAAISVAAASASGQTAIDGRSHGLDWSSYTLDFNNLSPGATPGTMGPLHSAQADFGGLWTAGAAADCGEIFQSIALYNSDCVSGGIVTPTSIRFTAPVDAFAFRLISGPGFTIFTAFLGGLPTASFEERTDFASPDRWYGFENGPFDRVDIYNYGNHTNGDLGIDDLQVAVLPEPASVVLLTLGLVAVGATARRRKTG